MSTTDIQRPEPVFTPDSQFFWEAAKRRELQILNCADCQRLLHPPRPMCPYCHGFNLGPKTMSGQGRVYSWAMPIHPFPWGFSTPPIVALIDLAEGVRIVSNVVGVDPYKMTAGIEVRVDFEPAQNDTMVPVFVPVKPEDYA